MLRCIQRYSSASITPVRSVLFRTPRSVTTNKVLLRTMASYGVGNYDTITSGQRKTCWLDTAEPLLFQPLRTNLRADVCIIGAGIAGISTAYNLTKEGKRVVVLEDGAVCSGETGRTTAHLSWALDDFFQNLEKHFGRDGAKLCAESHRAAVDHIEGRVREEKIDCDFQRIDGYLFNPPECKDPQVLDREQQAVSNVGLTEVSVVPRAPIYSFFTGKALHYPNQGQFHPIKYVNHLAKSAARLGCQIFTQTKAYEFHHNKPLCKIVTSDGFSVEADHLVYATNVPLPNKLTVHAKMECDRSYVVAAPIPKSDFTMALYWDTLEPYHYVRAAPYSDTEYLLIVGGEDHLTGFISDEAKTGEPFKRLEAWARARWPSMGAVKYSWSGQVVEPVDFMQYIGVNPGDSDNVYIVTADSGNGMTSGVVAGILLTDMIQGRQNAWEKIYSPARIPYKAMGDMLKHDVEVNLQFKDYVTSGDVAIEDLHQIPCATGAIVRSGLSKMAVFKDEKGELHKYSAVCPHMKGLVRWNPTEKSWDCPLHGSRFDAYGVVVNGPAKSNLAPVEDSRSPTKLSAAPDTVPRASEA